MVASLLAAKGRDACGILFRILVADLTHDEEPGNQEGLGGQKMEPSLRYKSAGGLLEPRQRLLMGPWGWVSPALFTQGE